MTTTAALKLGNNNVVEGLFSRLRLHVTQCVHQSVGRTTDGGRTAKTNPSIQMIGRTGDGRGTDGLMNTLLPRERRSIIMPGAGFRCSSSSSGTKCVTVT